MTMALTSGGSPPMGISRVHCSSGRRDAGSGYDSLDLNLLLVLDTVLSEQSVARAAKRLHVTPSAISNALARLRVALGDPLVTRKGRGIVATPRAAELAPALARALAELGRLIAHTPFDANRCTRTFTWRSERFWSPAKAIPLALAG
jgi:hypothetical protein